MRGLILTVALFLLTAVSEAAGAWTLAHERWLKANLGASAATLNMDRQLLLNRRIVLLEASKAYLECEQSRNAARLLMLWRRLYPLDFAQVSENLFTLMNREASQAESAQRYSRTTAFAFRLLAQFSDSDVGEITRLLEAWPRIHDLDSVEKDMLLKVAITSYIRGRSSDNPVEDVSALLQFEALYPTVYAFEARTLISYRLSTSGRHDHASDLVKESFRRFEQEASDRSLSDFVRSLYFVSRFDGSLFLEGLDVLEKRLRLFYLDQKTTEGVPVWKHRLLEAVSLARDRPEIMTSALLRRPALDTLRLAGGTKRDSPDVVPESNTGVSELQAPSAGGHWNAADIDPTITPPGMLTEELSLSSSGRANFQWDGGQAPVGMDLSTRKAINFIRKELRKPENFHYLLSLAGSNGYSVRVRQEALRVAAEEVEKISDPLSRARSMAKLLPLWRRVTARVPKKVLQSSRRLLDTMPPLSSEKAKSDELQRVITELQIALAVELFHVDFRETLAFLGRLAPDVRFSACLNIAGS